MGDHWALGLGGQMARLILMEFLTVDYLACQRATQMECSMECSRAEMRDSLTRTVDMMVDSTRKVVMLGIWLVTVRESTIFTLFF
eukprot:scaffold28412_cov48-Cyclotella_meneghiniana.AAC.5